jgi:hypothetical protein
LSICPRIAIMFTPPGGPVKIKIGRVHAVLGANNKQLKILRAAPVFRLAKA